MITKKKKELSFVEKIRKINRAGIDKSPCIYKRQIIDKIEPLPDRIKRILGITKNQKLNSKEMIYFVMYDIENNKVRNQIAKYLIKKGCARVQRSIFLAKTDRKIYNQIKNDLSEVQACYENTDSIFVVPVSGDEIKAMKVIGQNIDFDFVLQNKNTMFF